MPFKKCSQPLIILQRHEQGIDSCMRTALRGCLLISTERKWKAIFDVHHHKNGIFYFRYLIPHSCDRYFLEKNFLSKNASSYSSLSSFEKSPVYLFLSIQRSRSESSFGMTVPPSQLAFNGFTSLAVRSITYTLSIVLSYKLIR